MRTMLAIATALALVPTAFGSTDEECYDVGAEKFAPARANCETDLGMDGTYDAYTAICRAKVGKKPVWKTTWCPSVRGANSGYSGCISMSVPAPDRNALKRCWQSNEDKKRVDEVEASWTSGTCYVKGAPEGTFVKGKETRKGCKVSTKTIGEYYYTSDGSVPAFGDVVIVGAVIPPAGKSSGRVGQNSEREIPTEKVKRGGRIKVLQPTKTFSGEPIVVDPKDSSVGN
jgi:hypothetical protein